MIARYNCFCTVWRLTNITDDEVGGAVITGTVAYTGLQTFLESRPVEQILLQQGYEAQKTFTATIVPGYLDIREKDELEVTAPVDHYYYGQRFRITGVQVTDLNRRDPRNYMLLSLVRSERAHTVQ